MNFQYISYSDVAGGSDAFQPYGAKCPQFQAVIILEILAKSYVGVPSVRPFMYLAYTFTIKSN